MSIKRKLTKKDKETIKFLKGFFLPQNESEEIAVKAHSLAGAFLVQIEKVLEEKNLSQKDLAKKIGTSPSYLSQIFHSQVLLNFKTLAKIERALDIEFKISLEEKVNSFYNGKENNYFKEIESINLNLPSKKLELAAA